MSQSLRDPGRQRPWRMEDAGEAVRAGTARAALAVKNVKAYTALKWDIMDLQAKRRQRLLQVGELVYATHAGRPAGSEELERALRLTDAVTAALREKEAELERLEGLRPCPGCGSAQEAGHAYCSRCGRAL